MKIAIFSFFAGCGLIDLGFENAGFEVVFVNEYMPKFLEAYRHNRQHTEPLFGYHSDDITDFLADKKEQLRSYLDTARQHFDYVGFIGGPPCPDFSVAGKNAGSEGKNGRLSGVYVDLITEFKPDFFLFENVKGLVQNPKHLAYFTQLESQLKANYWTSWRVVNALSYGVPQNRERVIILGFLEKTAVNWLGQQIYNAEAIKKLPWPKAEPFVVNSVKAAPDNVPLHLTVEHWWRKQKTDEHPNAVNVVGNPANSRKYQELAEGSRGGSQSNVRLHRWRYSSTACYGHANVPYHPYQLRHLTVAETLAIQSAPPQFNLPQNNTITNLYRMVGNAVPYLMAKGLANTIKDSLT